MKKIVLVIILFLGIGSGILLTQTKSVKQVNQKKIAQKITKKETIPALPTVFKIPKLNLETNIEYVGLDREGKMDIPENPDNVAWFELGYRPGQMASSVIAGHFDKVSGAPAVFYNLRLLKIGDKINIEAEDGKEYVFLVKEKKLYPFDQFPTQVVFGPSKKRMLNLITCDGVWDLNNKNYSNRLVVFTELAE